MRDTDLHQVLALAEAVAAAISAEAINPAADLTQRERRALMALALGVEAAATRAVGVIPRTPQAEAVLMRAMLATVLPDYDP